MSNVIISRFDPRFQIYIPRIKRTTTRVLSFLRQDTACVEIFLITSRQMRALYHKVLHKDHVADILSFPEPRDFVDPEVRFRKLGEIYLNIEKTSDYRLYESTKRKRVRAIRGAPWTINVLLIHGILHLLGYDHVKKDDIMRMERLEQSLLRRLHVRR